jgi:hypothetical protein
MFWAFRLMLKMTLGSLDLMFILCTLGKVDPRLRNWV